MPPAGPAASPETPLTALHRQAGVALVEREGALVPERFGGLREEHRFLRETVGVIDRSARGLIVVKGKTATDFLQRLLANDVRALGGGEGQPSCLLTGKGKLIAAFHIYRLSQEAYSLHLGEPLREEVARLLEKYGALEGITVEASPREGDLSLAGPRAADLLQGWIEEGSLPAAPLREEAVLAGGFWVLIRRQTDAPRGGFEVRKAEPALWEALVREARRLGGGPVGWEAAEVQRIEAGIPRWGVDFDGSNFPNEAGWESALSYTKGCYIGQEVIARMRTYGHLNRKLMSLRFPGAREAPAGTPLYREGKEVGAVTSSAVSPGSGATVALGYVRPAAFEPGTRLAAGSPAGPAEVEVAARAGLLDWNGERGPEP